ncbi:hypothetical protein PATA110616_16655 [Paenibacillus tarimensis]
MDAVYNHTRDVMFAMQSQGVYKSATIVHLANGNDNSLYRWNIGSLISNGANFDIVGMSLYPSMAVTAKEHGSRI